MDDNLSLGSRLRILRQERELSQRRLAEKAGISPNAISLIERNEISPSVATLQHLAGALSVKMSYFFDGAGESNVIYAKAGKRPTLVSNGVSIEGITARLHDQHIDPFYLTLAPHADAGAPQVVHTGQEFVYCLRGCVEYTVDGTMYALSVGDFLLFEATLPHYWRNPTEQSAELLLVLHTDESSGDLARLHFTKQPSIAQLG
jgi:transcriptional regulator with XRE-family HTH domain